MDAATGRDTTAEMVSPRGSLAFGRPPGSIQTSPAAACGSETIFLTEMVCGGRAFLFNRPLPVRVLQEDGGCSLESEDYGLLAYGRDRPEAESSFRHVFAHHWDKIARADDAMLTPGAAALKRALLALVKSQK